MSASVPSRSSQKPLILVADDDKTIQNLLKITLERNGYQIVPAINGVDAVRLALELRPSLILMDVKMPLMDGFEAVVKLRENPTTARIPVIFLTAAAMEPSDTVRGFDLGADDYLHKPFGVEELIARAQSKIRAYQLEERLQKRTQELEILVQIGAQLNEAVTVPDLVDRLTNLAMHYLHATTGAMLIKNDQQPHTLYVRLWDRPLEMLPSPSTHFSSYVFRRAEPFLFNDQVEATERGIILDGNIESGIGAPLIHRGRTLGSLTLGHSEPDFFTQDSLRVLRSVAEQASLALQNAQLHTELQGYVQNLEAMVETRTTALQAAQAQLMRAEKMAAIGTLAAGVAHEVNNPLQPILMNLEMALEDVELGRPADPELLEAARMHVQRITELVRRLLDFARPERQMISDVDINAVVAEVLSLAGKQLQHAGVRVETRLARLPSIPANADQLKQVVLNLVVNAMDAMPRGGTLTLRTWDEDDWVWLAVHDTGIGIPPNELPKVFDPFFTTKTNGTGLGLAVSYGLIEGHGGQIEVTSVPGHETEFTVCLPKVAPELS